MMMVYIDALDGVMGRIIDKSGLQYRVLNRSKGAAVQGPRAQADRDLYRSHMRHMIENYPNLSVTAGGVEDLLLDETNQCVRAVVLGSGEIVHTNHTIITTGTFLRGMLHIGPTIKHIGGRHGDTNSVGLSATFERIGFNLNRLTTATPPRLDGRTIDYKGLDPQYGNTTHDYHDS